MEKWARIQEATLSSLQVNNKACLTSSWQPREPSSERAPHPHSNQRDSRLDSKVHRSKAGPNSQSHLGMLRFLQGSGTLQIKKPSSFVSCVRQSWRQMSIPIMLFFAHFLFRSGVAAGTTTQALLRFLGSWGAQSTVRVNAINVQPELSSLLIVIE